MLGADLSAEVTTPQPYTVAGRGGAPVHGRRARPGHQAQRRRAGSPPAASPPTCCRRRPRWTSCSRSAPTRCSSRPARATRPPPTTPVALARTVMARRIPLFGICFGSQILGRALGFGTYKLGYGHRGINQPVLDRATGKVEVTSHNHGFAVDAPLRRAGRHRVRRGRGQPRLPQRRRGRGAALPRRARLHRAVPPGGGGRAARRGLPVRPLRRADRGSTSMPKRTDLRHVLVIGSGPIVIGQACEFDYSGTQACRVLRAEGLRVIAGQLQPGDDHDRPGVRRRDLRRADHAGVRRAGDRPGAPGRAAGHPRRADRAEHGRRAARGRACWTSTASS